MNILKQAFLKLATSSESRKRKVDKPDFAKTKNLRQDTFKLKHSYGLGKKDLKYVQ